VIEAARAAAAGLDLEGVVERAEEVSSKIHLLATIGTLTHLHRGGRIGGAVALLGAMLQVKPVLSLTDGHVEVFARPRTQSKAVQIMVEEMAVRVGGKPVHIAILHADMLEDAEVLRQQVEGQFDCVELYVTELTPVMGAHTGPGVLGVVFYVD
jgi:DegV family protein with EDD domain